jgi:hypothetical protein
MWYNITFATGIILLLISLYILKGSLAFLRNNKRATATVIEMLTVKDSDGDTYKPVFKFKTESKEEVIFKSSTSSRPPAWHVGEETTIIYDPSNPSSARLMTYFGMFSWSIILMAIAMPMIVIGGGYYLSGYVLQ